MLNVPIEGSKSMDSSHVDWSYIFYNYILSTPKPLYDLSTGNLKQSLGFSNSLKIYLFVPLQILSIRVYVLYNSRYSYRVAVSPPHNRSIKQSLGETLGEL